MSRNEVKQTTQHKQRSLQDDKQQTTNKTTKKGLPSERAKRANSLTITTTTITTTTTMKQQQIQQLKAALYDCIFDHSQLHSMYTCGPRDEITGIIEPTAEQLAPVELLMDNIECQLIILGHSPAELPIWEEQEAAPF